MEKVNIDPEFKALIPPLSEEEHNQLEENLKQDGCRDPLVTWQGVLLDGHNRYEICTRLGIDFKVEEVALETKAEARIWMRNNQRGRRNLSDAWKIELELGNKEDLAKIGRERMSLAKQSKFKSSSSSEGLSTINKPSPEERPHNTREKIAKDAGVSAGKVGQAEVVRKKDPKLWEKAKESKITIGAAYKQVTKASKKEERTKDVEERMKDIAPANDRYTCHLKSCADLLEMPEGSVDWVITDPPYPKEFLPVYDDLAKAAAHILKPGGSLLCMVGQSYLPEIMAKLTAEMTYHWTIAYLTPGGQATQLFTRNVNTFWKPVLWFTKGEYKGQWIGDTTRSNVNDNDKNHHHWGQSCSGMKDLMQRFVKPGDTVVDPFMGAGTTGVVALDLGCHFVGHDIDQASFNEALVRLSDAAA